MKQSLIKVFITLGYGKKNYGVNTGGNGPHIDNPQRLISILIYIGGYKNIAGGEHRIYEKIKNELKIFETIKPIRNRLVASLQNNEAFLCEEYQILKSH